MNAGVAKLVAKLGLGAAASLVIGYTIKAEKAAVEKIEAHYDNKDKEDEETPTD